MCLKSDFCVLWAFIAHTANLQEAFAVTACDLGAIVVELAIVDVVLMLSVNREHIVR